MGYPIYRISSLTGEGVPALLYAISDRLKALPVEAPPPETEVVRFTGPQDEAWEVEVLDEAGAHARADAPRTREQRALAPETRTYVVRGKKIERLVAMTDMENEAGIRRLQRILERLGVVGRLRSMGAVDGDSVRIGSTEFDFID
jgi:GTP-binding protein